MPSARFVQMQFRQRSSTVLRRRHCAGEVEDHVCLNAAIRLRDAEDLHRRAGNQMRGDVARPCRSGEVLRADGDDAIALAVDLIEWRSRRRRRRQS